MTVAAMSIILISFVESLSADLYIRMKLEIRVSEV